MLGVGIGGGWRGGRVGWVQWCVTWVRVVGWVGVEGVVWWVGVGCI